MDYDSQNFSATGAGTYLTDDPDRHSRHDEFTGALWGEYVMADGRLVHRLEYQESVFKRRQDSNDETRGETRALKYRLSYGLDGRPVAEARHLLNLMIERVEDENDDAPDYARANNSLALEYRGFLENGLDIQAGLRRDDFDRFADFTSWNLGLSWQVPDSRYRLHASAGRGLVKPSYYELFADDAYTLGNPGLSPERNSGFDLGVEAELNLKPAKWLNVFGNIGYIDGGIDNNAANGQFRGNKFRLQPGTQAAAGFTIDAPLGDGIRFFATPSVTYRSKIY